MITLSGRYAEAPAELGLKPDDRVAAQVEKSVEALMLYLGGIRIGAIFLPLDTAYTSAELDYFLGDAEPKLLVCARRPFSHAPSDSHATRQEKYALIYELINSPAIRRPPPKIAAVAASPAQIPGDQDDGRRAASVFCRAGCVARSHVG